MMSVQSEYALEDALIKQLVGMEYARVDIEDEAAMLSNLKRQLEMHNKNIALHTRVNLIVFLII
jgi:type I restriction enzyme, R subunit